MTTYTFTVSGMHCASCALLIDETLEELPGVHRSTTTLRTGHAVVDLDDAISSPDAIVAAINETGYQARLTV